MQDKLEEHKKEAGNETELEDGIEKMHAADSRRGSTASQNQWVLHGPSLRAAFLTIGVDHAKQQLALFH